MWYVLPVQGVDVIMQAMALLADDPRIHFYFIGPVDQKVTPTESPNITYIRWLSQPELAERIRRMTVLYGRTDRPAEPEESAE